MSLGQRNGEAPMRVHSFIPQGPETLMQRGRAKARDFCELVRLTFRVHRQELLIYLVQLCGVNSPNAHQDRYRLVRRSCGRPGKP